MEKNSKISILFLLFIFPSLVFCAVTKKHETRVEIEVLPTKVRKLSRSVAAMIPKKWFIKTALENKYLLTYKKLKEEKNFCENEKFSNQASIAKCTGTLISNGRILTAAHCLDQNDIAKSCRDYFWVFDYSMTSLSQNEKFPEKKATYYNKNLLSKGKEIYECESVLKSEFKKNEIDFAVIKLKKSPDRPAIKIPATHTNFTQQVSIGFPNGVPMKGNQGKHFYEQENLAYNNMYAPVGSSGSPLFNPKNGNFLGMIISSTYTQDLNNNGCRFESTLKKEAPLTLYQKNSSIHQLLQSL